MAFSPNGKTLAYGSDKTVRLWDVDARQPLGDPLVGDADSVSSLAFSPDSKTLASGSLDKTVRLWDVDLDSWIERACQIANRNLSKAEWKQFMGSNVPYEQRCLDLPAGT